MELYRFRPISRILGDKELEDQYMFFTNSEQQNDPLEGYVDFFWQGDFVAWMGLFKNYVWQLYMCYINAMLRADYNFISKMCFTCSDVCISHPLLQKRNEIEQIFSCNEVVTKIAKKLCLNATKINQQVLYLILLQIHSLALNEVIQKLMKEKLLSPTNATVLGNKISQIENQLAIIQILDCQDLQQIANLIYTDRENHTIDIFSSMQDNLSGMSKEVKCFLLYTFPYKYIQEVKKLIFPRWYCVCFNTDYSNPIMWGHYAGKHTGVCLVFEKKTGEKFNLSSAGKVKQNSFEIEDVNYEIKPPSVNFFEGLGNLFGEERSRWLIHNNIQSETYSKILKDAESWRCDYWTKNKLRFIRKASDWKHENEKRIFYDARYYGELSDNECKFNYNFQDLTGIIFGVKTELVNKCTILKILEQKCKQYKREKFNIFQAVYDSEQQKIEKILLRTI